MSWQTLLQEGYASRRELLTTLDLPASDSDAEADFATRVPRGFVARMQPGNWDDPLLRQVLASDEELQSPPDYHPDPLAEKNANPIPGLLHKYQGRVLLTLTPSCAINCRYCFRRHFPYDDNYLGRNGWQAIVDYCQKDPSITEVILSGGDPLLVKDEILSELISALSSVKHLKRLRIHSRMPVVLPERITDELCTLLQQSRLKTSMVLHCNHPQELDANVKHHLQHLTQRQIPCLNQSVLLKGINDDVDVLCALSEKLFDNGVLPYYLHTLDKVQGVHHFDISEKKAISLHRGMKDKLPGYLVPRLVTEIAHQPSKLWLQD
jgi:L-lysine 2,3-aminomutase